MLCKNSFLSTFMKSFFNIFVSGGLNMEQGIVFIDKNLEKSIWMIFAFLGGAWMDLSRSFDILN